MWLCFAGISFVVPYLMSGGGDHLQARLSRWRVQRETQKRVSGLWAELTTNAPRVGGDGPIVLVEFSDYECAYCRELSPKLDSMLSEAGVALAYRHFPLRPLHPRAEGAARTAICASNQGRFRQMHHALMASSEWARGETQWTVFAAQVTGLDTNSLGRCLNSDDTSKRLAIDEALADSLRIGGTPTLLSRRGVFTKELTVANLRALAR